MSDPSVAGPGARKPRAGAGLMGGFLAGLMVYGRVLLDRIKQFCPWVLGSRKGKGQGEG